MMLNEKEKTILQNISASLGIQADSLYKLIKAESNWNPRAANPFSTAKGLLQFTDETARELGFFNSQDLINQYPNVETQLLVPVWRYLSARSPFRNEGDLYLSVFYPAARAWPRNREFPEFVQSKNPGIRTPQDYIDFVNKKIDPVAISLAVAALLGVLFYIFLQRG